MSRYYEIYVRNTRDELGRYPNWPINQKITLGKVGYYRGRTAVFDWETHLDDLGIEYKTTPAQQFMSELYTSQGAVSVKFNTDDGHGNSKASFDFKRKRSVATQGFEMGYLTLDISKLKDAILEKMKNGLRWDYDWVIISELWAANGFTTLISNSSESSSEISTNLKIADPAFNVADPSLSLQITKSTKMSYQGIAEREVQPYFTIHRLTRDHKIKRYASGLGFWGN